MQIYVVLLSSVALTHASQELTPKWEMVHVCQAHVMYQA